MAGARAALMRQKQDVLATRIAGLDVIGSGWTAKARAAALDRLNATGLPVRRDEYWRYTDPTALTALVPETAPADGEAPIFAGVDALRLVFVDGVFDAAQSDDPALAGVEFAQLADVASADIHWAGSLYGVLEARGQTPVERPLAGFNTAFAENGVLMKVTGRTEKPVSLIYQTKSERSDAILHHCVILTPGAEITLLEQGLPGARFNTVLEVEIGDGARFHHVRSQGRSDSRLGATHVFARLGSDALFKGFTLSANGRLTRNEAVLELTGDDSMAHVAGTSLGDGAVLHDDTVFITHAAERCESRQVYKKVLMNGATGVFQGKILVQPGAQKTDGYQISQSLLLDGDSNFLAKPELEIYADDVKCSHGSTSGAIDETALFYLRSRGVPKHEAQSLLVLAFLAEAIGEIEDETIAEDIRQRLEIWLRQSRG